jgi:hypothetical protein
VTTEATIERHLALQVRRHGGWCVKLVPWAHAGLPDRMVLLPGMRLAFVELKRPAGGKLRPAQRLVRQRLETLGWTYHLLRTKQQVDDLINRLTGDTDHEVDP